MILEHSKFCSCNHSMWLWLTWHQPIVLLFNMLINIKPLQWPEYSGPRSSFPLLPLHTLGSFVAEYIQWTPLMNISSTLGDSFQWDPEKDFPENSIDTAPVTSGISSKPRHSSVKPRHQFIEWVLGSPHQKHSPHICWPAVHFSHCKSIWLSNSLS